MKCRLNAYPTNLTLDSKVRVLGFIVGSAFRSVGMDVIIHEFREPLRHDGLHVETLLRRLMTSAAASNTF